MLGESVCCRGDCILRLWLKEVESWEVKVWGEEIFKCLSNAKSIIFLAGKQYIVLASKNSGLV